MSTEAFFVLFVFGSGAVALWIDVRFPRIAPRDPRGALVRLLIALAVAFLVAPLAINVAGAALASPVLLGLAVFAIAFAGVTYALLTAVWVIRVGQGMMFGGVR